MANPSVPPTPPPPPVPGSPDGFGPLDELGDGWEPRQEVSHGLITILGVLCILFAVACGCMHFFALAPLVADVDWSEEARKGQEEQRKTIEEELSKIEDPQEREQMRRSMEAISFEHWAQVSPVMPNSSHFGALKTRAQISAGFQVSMLVLGFLLLLRFRLARTFGIILCIGTIAAIILTAMAFPPVFEDAVTEAQQILADNPDASPEERASFSAWALAWTPENMRATALSLAATSVVFPFICLLILLFAGGIRRSLASKSYEAEPSY